MYTHNATLPGDSSPRQRFRASMTSLRSSRKSHMTPAPSMSDRQDFFNSEVSPSMEDPAWFASFTERSSSSVARSVTLSDQELCTRAKITSASIDFHTITDLSLNKWSWHSISNDFAFFTMSSESDPRQLEVLAAGDICCSLEEVASVLTSLTDPELNATMQGLCKKEFIYGSVVHVVPPECVAAEGSFGALVTGDYVAVKTATFVRSNMFARNEEWCFLESCDRCPSGMSFCLTQSTVSASEIEVGRASHSRVDQLCGITTSILVEKLPGTRSVRVFFHGEHRTHLSGGTKGIVSLKATKARLMMLAKTVSRIPDIVHRRRLGIQKLASRSVFAVKNTRCLCCTKGLHFLAKKKRCYMCGYFVCDKCWLQQVMETHNNKITAVVVCTRCVDYANVREHPGVRYSERLSERVPEFRRHRDLKSADTPGKALVDLLENAALDDSDEMFQEATISVIKDILTQEKEVSMPSVESTPASSSLDSQVDPVQMLEKRFDHIASRRMSMPLKSSSSMPEFRVPTQQGEPLHMNSDCKFLNLGEVTELNILCALATNELKCTMSQITIVDQDSELIVASNVMKPRYARIARSHAFCSHLIMDGNPLVLHDPEVNEHLCHLDAVTKQDIRFFCGFPITAEDGTVLGSLCCLDFRDHELTQSQYSMMTKLAKTASNVIQSKRSTVLMPTEQPAPQ
ncbi:hypothetical protein FI667_g13967, partial [Globisporangium splendens]